MKNILKNRFKNKYTIIFLSLSFVLLIVILLLQKNEFFYTAINYFSEYLDYYINKYLLGNINDLLIDNGYLLYIENDLQNIFSSVYIHIITFSNILYKIYTYIFPVIVFALIAMNLHDELHNKADIPIITRIGKKKYINNTLIANSIYGGLVSMLPKLLYLVILMIFFPITYSNIHYISTASFVSFAYLFTSYPLNPYIMIIFDLVLTFLYGVFISLISLLVIILVRNKGLSYIIYIFTLAILSIIGIIFSVTPIIYYNSIFGYFNGYITSTITYSSILQPILILIILNYILYFIIKIIYKKKLDI